MYAPLPSLASRSRATSAGPVAIGRIALLMLPVLVLLTGPWLVARDTGLVGAPVSADPDTVQSLGAVLATTRVAPAVSWLAAAVAVVALYAGHRLRPDWWVPRRPGRADPDWFGGRTWYGLAVGVVGVGALVSAVGGWFGAPGWVLAIVVNHTTVFAGAAFLAALLTMPAARGLWVRLRRALDGAIVGLCLMFCGWMLLVMLSVRTHTAALWIVTFCCWVLATALVSAAGSGVWERGPMLCAAGVGAAMAGLPGLAFALANAAPGWWLAVTTALLLAAPVLVWRGANALAEASRGAQPTGSVDGSAEAMSRPVIVCSALALAVALYALATGGVVDRAAMVFGTLAVLAAGLRHLLVTRVPAARTAPAASAAGPVAAVPRPRAEDEATRPPVQTDAVTGLANPERLAWSIAAMRSAPRSPGALLLVGIDGLDTVPDAARDGVLRELADRLTRFVALRGRDGTGLADLPARWSETEFALLTPANLAQAYAMAQHVATLLADPVTVPGAAARLSVCVGVSDLAGASSTDDAVARAQIALRRARQLGPGRVEWYDTAVAEAVARREILGSELPDALRRGEFDLIYQPIIDLDRGRPLGVEALLRWRHPRFGTLLPGDVIPVAEETGVIVDIDRWALRRALARLAAWRPDDRNLFMAINVSCRTLAAPAFPEEVAAALAEHGLAPDRLMVEVAESEVEEGTALDDGVAALRAIGVRTALDAFGTGVASLAHLRRLPIDMIKIGKSFFETASRSGPGSDTELPMIDVMVGVGRRLGIDVVAQGVEAPAHLSVVRSAGCRIGQGHLFARPQPAEHTEAYLDGFLARP